MLIKYSPVNQNVKIVPLIPVGGMKVELTRAQVSLLPGTNEVTNDEWEVMKLHLKEDIKTGVIKTIETDVQKSDKNQKGKAQNLTEYPAGKAVALVAECVNPETLTKWHKEETREEVRMHIVEKMKELKMDIPKLSVADDFNDVSDEQKDSDDKSGKGAAAK